MGLLSLFKTGPLSEKKIARVAKLAANPFAQPDVRMREMQRLIQDGSYAALRGVLRRFAANAQGHIADEDEKKWLEDALVGHGSDALPALRSYIEDESKITYALRAYRRIAGNEAAVTFFLVVLKKYGPEDYRSSEAKLQLVWELSEHLDDERVFSSLCPFLNDHSDDVRWAILDLLERLADAKQLSAQAQEASQAALLALVTDASVSQRIARRTADLLSQREWQLPAGPDALNALLDDSYFLDKKRIVRRRTGRHASSASADPTA